MAKAKYKVDQNVRFKGYEENTPDEERLLEEGEVYTVIEVNAEEESVAVQIPNPDFNPKKKITDDNSEVIIVDVFFNEIEPADDDEEEEKASAKSKTSAKAKPVTKGKGKAKVEEEEDADEDPDNEEGTDEDEDEDEKSAPKSKAKAAASSKTAAKAKTKEKPAAKGKSKLKEKSKEPAAEEDKYGDLTEDQEDKAVLEMIEDSEDVVELAKEVAEQSSTLEYQLGGILFHLRRDKAYIELDKRYAQKGAFGVPSGFEIFLSEVLGLEYRKAMYLIDIYYKFSKYGIEAEKVAEIGWTKASKIAAVMTEDNAEDLVELASDSTVSELSASIKETYVDAGEKTDKQSRRKTTFKFALFEDQAVGVKEVLETAAENLSMKLDDLFEHIVMEWAAENDISVSKKKPAKTEAKAGKASSKPSVGKTRTK